MNDQNMQSMDTLEIHTVENLETPERLSEYLIHKIKALPTGSSLRKAIKRKQIYLNSEIANSGDWLQSGDCIEYREHSLLNHPVFNLDIDIVFEDDFLAVINKPPGIEVRSKQFKSIENALRGHLKISGQNDALPSPRAVHRLDYGTQGLLVIAKTRTALAKIGQAFEAKEVKKNYIAIVHGELPATKGEFQTPIEMRTAHSIFEVISCSPALKGAALTKVLLEPITGRTHQLRIHLSQAGCPIVGDLKYGSPENTLKGKGLFLASTHLNFKHPISNNELQFNLKVPLKFDSFLNREHRRWKKYNEE